MATVIQKYDLWIRQSNRIENHVMPNVKIVIIHMHPSIPIQNHLINKQKFQKTMNQKIISPCSHPHTSVSTLMSSYSQNDVINNKNYKFVPFLKLSSLCPQNHLITNKKLRDCMKRKHPKIWSPHFLPTHLLQGSHSKNLVHSSPKKIWSTNKNYKIV